MLFFEKIYKFLLLLFIMGKKDRRRILDYISIAVGVVAITILIVAIIKSMV